MTREQAINYLFSRGFTNEQVGEVVRALTYKPRDCANCKHYVVTDTRTNWGSQETTKIYGCECWECEYEPTTKNDLGVDCISRQAAIDCLDWSYPNELPITKIKNLPSVTPQPRWIPASERLPDKNVWVLVTVEQSGMCHQEIMRRNKYIEAWTDNIDNYTDEITAWMPLPQPYREVEE